MSRFNLPTLQLILSKTEARRFLLAHQNLWPPRRMKGKDGIMQFIRQVGCIQFDPISIVARNADLVLQARLADFRPGLLDELLYGDRLLWDGWDKVAAIYLARDWPYFARQRAAMRRDHGKPDSPVTSIAPTVLQTIRERGPLSSIDLEKQEKIHWSWGRPVHLTRAALEVLYAMGELGIHHRVGTRRVFDLIERLLPAELLAEPDPNPDDSAYQDWHLLRRVGGMGLAQPGASEYWLGLHGMKSQARQATLARLVDRGELLAASIEGLPNRSFFLRTADLATLDTIRKQDSSEPGAAFIGPLDNLIWDRNLLSWIFDFEYRWEVYTPASLRKYGYYVLPVLYGDKFIARFEPVFGKKTRRLAILGWWWETGVQPDDSMQAALTACMRDFINFLQAEEFTLAEIVAQDASLQWMKLITDQ